MRKSTNGAEGNGAVRYAVVGLGHIAQMAVLPAFKHAKENSELTALVSSDAEKLEQLGKEYSVKHLYSYEEYERCLKSGQIDAVYIALPNSMHEEYAVRAAQAGIHVLCEKPLAVTQEECRRMIRACRENHVRLMTAYRLHFEEANLKAIEIAKSGDLGEVRFFDSAFALQIEEGDIRLQKALGGGTLYDIGIYCINAARNIFQAEPVEVFALAGNNGEKRFSEVEEMIAAVMKFPDNRLASFTCSFGTEAIEYYRIAGSKGDLLVEPAYHYAKQLGHKLTIEGKSKEQTFRKRDQFAPELVYFSKCVLEGTEPEPSGLEGLVDVRIIEALYRSVEMREPVQLAPLDRDAEPGMEQEMHKPAVRKPKLVNTE